MTGERQQVVVVTGGAGGIGAAIAEACGQRGDYVVTLDPVVELDGSPQHDREGRTTAERIVDAGGQARASGASVTDARAVRDVLTGLVDEFGGVDAVVNVAGISRPTGFAHGTEEDWVRVLDVHLGGHLTLLRESLPFFAAAGRGRFVGVTSGSGWRAADAGAYSCAKRAVASLTWQLGRNPPDGVSINALSPIAATRMVTRALARSKAEQGRGPKRDASGGVALGAALPPEALAPVGAHLVGEDFAWCSGEVLFANGAELSVVEPPHLIEMVRTSDVPFAEGLFNVVTPSALAIAEARQTAGGSGVPRLGGAFTAQAPAPDGSGRCLLVSNDAAWRDEIRAALEGRGRKVILGDPSATDFASAAREVATGTPDAVIVALMAKEARSPAGHGDTWASILEGHAGIEDAIRRDAAWVRAVADHSAQAGQPVRVVTITQATSPGGRSRAMSAAQLSRAAQSATEGRVAAFSIAAESARPEARRTTAALVGHLVECAEESALSGAELVTDENWAGLRSHPGLRGTVSYGGPELPSWIDDALRGILSGDFRKSPKDAGRPR